MDTKVFEQQKSFSSKAGEVIGYEKGAKMVKNYFDKNKEIISHFMGRDTIESILSQPGVVGITMFSGIDQNGNPKPILVGVDAKGNYVLNITSVGINGELTKQKGVVAIGIISPGTGTSVNPNCGWW